MDLQRSNHDFDGHDNNEKLNNDDGEEKEEDNIVVHRLHQASESDDDGEEEESRNDGGIKRRKIDQGRNIQSFQSLKELIEHLHDLETTDDEDVEFRVWMSDSSFIVDDPSYERSLAYAHWFTLRTDLTLDEWCEFAIFASTFQEAIVCLNHVLCLPHDSYPLLSIEFFKQDSIGKKDEVDCSLPPEFIQKILTQQDAKRKYAFGSPRVGYIRSPCANKTIFTPEQCVALATSGKRTNLQFDNCLFQDHGNTFINAKRLEHDSGPAKLEFRFRLPLKAEILRKLISSPRLESLTIGRRVTLDEECCKAVLSSNELPFLNLSSCTLHDKGAELIKCVQEGRGPQHLRVNKKVFKAHDGFGDRFSAFLEGLARNTHLQAIEFEALHCYHDESDAICEALEQNSTLKHLGVLDTYCVMDPEYWTELITTISTHLSLLTLHFSGLHEYYDDDGGAHEKRKQKTDTLAAMLDINNKIVQVNFDDNTFDQQTWEELIVPRLERNYKTFQDKLRSMPAAALARVIASVGKLANLEKDRPSLIYQLLVSKVDGIVASW